MAPISSIVDLVKQHAVERGQQTAFSGPAGRVVTYADLLVRTGRIAGHLVNAGITRGSRVAVVLGNIVETAESTIAIARAAAVGVSLDPRSSQVELARALENSHAGVVITDDRRLGRVLDAVAGGVAKAAMIVVVGCKIDADAEKIAEGPVIVRYEDWVDFSAKQSAPDDLGLDEPAWLQYTTGTTGEPKGVLSSQRAYMWTVMASYVPSLGLTGADRLFWPLPLFHAFGHSLGVIGTLAVGASAHLLGDEPLLDSLLRHPETTILAGAPATFRELATDTAARPALSNLRPRVCISSGAGTPAGLSKQVEAVLGVSVVNQYGSTECGLIATTRPGIVYDEKLDTCGPPAPGIDVQIRPVHPDGQVTSQEVVAGEEGEIWVRTPSFMLGYDVGGLPLPAIEDDWFQTGDLGRLRSGLLTVTGRLKELIIRGGENIHPCEVERPLQTSPGVADVIVTGIPHDMLGEVPTAFLVPEAQARLDVNVLLKACRAMLPDYKVPVAFYTVDAIPRTASGKPKRLAMMDLWRTGTYCRPLAVPLLAVDLVEPLVLAESAAVCGCGLGLEQVDPDQSFATLGLSSLTGVVLRDRLASLTGLDLPVTLVFDHPTPAAVSGYLRERLYGTRPTQLAAPRVPDTAAPANGPEPIAIVSIACRYPGGISSPEDLWRVVSEGLDVTSDFPTNRDWDIDALYDPDPNKTGSCTTRRGGFLHDMADFDAGFFGLSPREALATDPQQRLLLETTHWLIERARIAPSSLRGTDTGVFVGMIYSDYASRFGHGSGSGQGHEAEAHLDIGASPSVAAGRISYSFDLKGPSMAIDAACSSSLTAIHLAAASLQTGESSLVIAGGVTVMSTPRQFVAFSRQRGLSTDGRCRSYSSDASGTGWSEGVGLVLLERLSDAQRHGHPVLGLVRSSAVNSGGTANGLTAPSGPAQRQVIRQALDRAALSPADVDVLDGHGTATSLGDPIEVQAVLQAYGARPPSSPPLLLGSVKSNIGHTQAAAGIASIVKMVYSMQHGVVPASIHIAKPTPHVDWTSGTVELLTETRPWPQTAGGRPRRAAVSSFGISGTNAHVILEQAPNVSHVQQQREQPSCPTTAFPWLLSGADDAALQAQARTLAALHTPADNDLHALDVALSLASTRSALGHRAAVTAASNDERRAALLALAAGRPHSGVATGRARIGTMGRSQLRSQSRLAFLFSGQGSQRPEMGRELAARFPQFDTSFREVLQAFSGRLEQPLADVINSPEPQLLDRADFAQAAVFAFEVALYRLLESLGIRPDYVAGHSLGEVAAAHVAGILSLTDAVALISARGTLMAALPEGGAMASIAATEDEVARALRDVQPADASTAVIAAVNAQDAVVVSGPTRTVLAIKDAFAAQGRPATRLRVSHAFHSPLMEPVLSDLSSALGRLAPSPGPASTLIPLVSTVTGQLVDAADMTADYWLRHVTAPVRFIDAVQTLSVDLGVATFVEIGPSAPLTNYVSGAIATSRQKVNEVDTLLTALGQLWVHGIQPHNWEAVFRGSSACFVDLPVYPFQRRRYWLDSPVSTLSCGVSKVNGETGQNSQNIQNGYVRVDTPPSTPPAEECINSIYAWQRQLGQLPIEMRHATLLDLMQDEVAVVLGYSNRQQVPSSAWDTPLTELGFDSVLSILLRNQIGNKTGVMLPANLVFNEAIATVPGLTSHVFSHMMDPLSGSEDTAAWMKR